MSASIAPECNDIKEKYDTCFLKWYSEKYLRGNTSSNECEELFKKYRTCLNKTLQDRGIENMLDDARKVTKDADADYNKR